MKETEKTARYTIVEHQNTFNSHKWYSLWDNKENVEVELDNRSWDYALEVCRKFNKEDERGLHS